MGIVIEVIGAKPFRPRALNRGTQSRMICRVTPPIWPRLPEKRVGMAASANNRGTWLAGRRSRPRLASTVEPEGIARKTGGHEACRL